jgi:H+/gluconate symporter-like permease
MLVLADNQASSAAALRTVKGAVVLGGLDTAQGIAQFTQQITHCDDPKILHQMAQNAATVLDGHGTHRVYQTLMEETLQ